MSTNGVTCSVLLVCTANRCRSPMAAGLLMKAVADRLEAGKWSITSAGTWAEPNLPATALVTAVMAERGIDLSQHRARMGRPRCSRCNGGFGDDSASLGSAAG